MLFRDKSAAVECFECALDDFWVEDKIIEALIECPEITRNELAIKLDLKPEAIKYRLKILKEAGRIEHQGSTKAGKWVVLK